jgi:hypothetical protein
MLKDHEKFIAFCLLGASLVGLAIMAYFRPFDRTDTASIGMLNSIIGALTLAFGGAANALFRTGDKVTVDNQPNDPVPTMEKKK